MENEWLRTTTVEIAKESFLIVSLKQRNIHNGVIPTHIRNGLLLESTSYFKNPKIYSTVFTGIQCTAQTTLRASTDEFKDVTGYSLKVFTLLLKKHDIFLKNPLMDRKPVNMDYMEHADGYRGFEKDLQLWQQYEPMLYADPIILKIQIL